MAFFSGLVNGFRRALDPTRLSMSQALLAGDYGAAAEMAQRFRQLQAEHDRLRTWNKRKASRKRDFEDQALMPAEDRNWLDTFDSPAAQSPDEVDNGAMPDLRPVSFQEGFDRQRRRAELRSSRMGDAANAAAGPPPAPRTPPAQILEDLAAGFGKPPLAPRLPGDADNRVRMQKQRENGGINGWGYMPSAGDRELLARIIYAESFNTPEDDAAIGWATVNRVGRRGFPNTLNGVLRQADQFQIVSEGDLGRGDSNHWIQSGRPERLSQASRDRLARARAIADGILNGEILDPTPKATHFHSSADPSNPTSGSPWFTSTLANKRLVPALYKSRARGPTRNYFYNLNESPNHR